MKYNKKHIVLTILLPLFWYIIQILSQKPQWIENYYSNGIYPVISKILRTLFGWLPFSFGDALGLFLIIVFIRGVYKLIKNRFKNSIAAILRFTATISLIYFCFYFFWGLNYFRKPLATNLNIKQSEYTTAQLLTTTEKVIDNLNKIHCKITANDTVLVVIPYTINEIYEKTSNGYKNIAKTYPQLTYETPSVKSSLISLFQSYTGTSGYLNPITGEAQVNSMIPKNGMPATACHEIAHQIGWSPENEANFIGFLTAINNDDIYFKYSGYRMAFHYCMREIAKRDKAQYKMFWNYVNKGVSKDFKTSYEHWKQFDNPIEPYFKKGYSSYLKANNQEKGIDSYSYVVDLLITYFDDNK